MGEDNARDALLAMLKSVKQNPVHIEEWTLESNKLPTQLCCDVLVDRLIVNTPVTLNTNGHAFGFASIELRGTGAFAIINPQDPAPFVREN